MPSLGVELSNEPELFREVLDDVTPRLNGSVEVTSEFAEEACAFIGIERADEVILVGGGSSIDHLAVFKLEADVLDTSAASDDREAEADVTVGRCFYRAGEDLSTGEVAATVAIDPGATANVDLEVGIWSGEVNIALAVQPIDQALLLFAEFKPGGNGIVLIQFHAAHHELGECSGVHVGILRVCVCWVEREGPVEIAISRTLTVSEARVIDTPISEACIIGAAI